MGKLIGYILIISVFYILFAMTGQLGVESDFSLIVSALANPELLLTSAWWLTLIKGTGGISALIVGGGIIAGIATRNSDITIFSAMAAGLVLLSGDFILIFNNLKQYNFPLAIIIMSPIIVSYAMVVVDWLRGKD